MKGKTNRHSDIWALGGIALFVITKQHPYIIEHERGESIKTKLAEGRKPEIFEKVREEFPEIYELLL